MKQHDFQYETPKIKFSMHYKHKLISFEELKKYEVSKEEKISACTHVIKCANFGNCWSCPPVSTSLDVYNLKKFKNCLVYSFWVDWDFEINSDNSYFKLINANRTVSPYAYKYGTAIEHIIGGKLMLDGRCPICRICMKKLDKPCLFPQKRRSSLEAVGIHATNLCEQVLDHQIQWYKKENGKQIEPEYITVIHGLLTNLEEEPETIINTNPNRSLF